MAAADATGARRDILSLYAPGLVHCTQGGRPPWASPLCPRGEVPRGVQMDRSITASGKFPLVTYYLLFFTGCCAQVGNKLPTTGTLQLVYCSWDRERLPIWPDSTKTTRGASEAMVPTNLQKSAEATGHLV